MAKKVLYIDCETTGLDPVRNGIVQLAALIEVDGELVAEQSWRIQPLYADEIDDKALAVHGMDREKIKSFPPAPWVFCEFTVLLGRYVNKFNKLDKYYPAGYNVRFDLDFLAQWFKKQGDPYFESWQNWRALDPLPFLYSLDFHDAISLPNYKLETVCAHFGIPLEAHNALSDVRAAREIQHRLWRTELIPTPGGVATC